jgi:hypothetical protein
MGLHHREFQLRVSPQESQLVKKNECGCIEGTAAAVLAMIIYVTHLVAHPSVLPSLSSRIGVGAGVFFGAALIGKFVGLWMVRYRSRVDFGD